MLRVTFVVPTLDRSGAEKQLTMLAVAGHRTAFDADVICLDRAGPFAADLAAAGIPVQCVEKRSRFDPFAIRRLRTMLAKRSPDVVHSWLFASLGYVWLSGWRRPWVHSLRCVDSWMSRSQRWQFRLFRSGPTAYTANSRAVADWYAGQGLQTQTIPNAITCPSPDSAPGTAFRRELGISDTEKLVVSVGRLAPQKRLDDLVWAFQLLRQTDPRSFLAIVGDGPLLGELRQRTVDLECAERVRFVGHRDQTGPVFAAADAFWLGSDFEGQSNSLMEAMAAGVPVVATSIPPNRELVTHGESGFLVDVGDSAGFAQFTAKLFGDDEVSRRLADAARNRMATSHPVGDMVDAYRELYRRVAASSTGSA